MDVNGGLGGGVLDDGGSVVVLGGWLLSGRSVVLRLLLLLLLLLNYGRGFGSGSRLGDQGGRDRGGGIVSAGLEVLVHRLLGGGLGRLESDGVSLVGGHPVRGGGGLWLGPLVVSMASSVDVGSRHGTAKGQKGGGEDCEVVGEMHLEGCGRTSTAFLYKWSQMNGNWDPSRKERMFPCLTRLEELYWEKPGERKEGLGYEKETKQMIYLFVLAILFALEGLYCFVCW